jgi:hypothetical protein
MPKMTTDILLKMGNHRLIFIALIFVFSGIPSAIAPWPKQVQEAQQVLARLPVQQVQHHSTRK